MAKMTRILIVERNPFFADVLACMLGLENYDVTVAHTAADGIRLGTAHRPDVVVAAWSLQSDIHGGEVCRRIRNASPHTKAVIITGRDEFVSQAKRCCRCVVAVLSKPFHREEILGAVRKALCGNGAPSPISSLLGDLPGVKVGAILIPR
jgi:two-component system, OmpR family, response regulator